MNGDTVSIPDAAGIHDAEGTQLRWTMRLALISTLLATAALAHPYALRGYWTGTLIIVDTGILWLVGRYRRWRWMPSLALALFLGAAVIGMLWMPRSIWMMLGIVAAVSAWDLDHFAQRVRAAGRVEGARDLETRHLQRLLLVDSLGLGLGAVALRLRVTLDFPTALLLAFVAVLGLSWAVRSMRRESD